MITKEQALTLNTFTQTHYIPGTIVSAYGGHIGYFQPSGDPQPLDKPRTWRRNGKTKVWVKSPEKFRIPVKFGLYEYGYITEENAHLFESQE